MPVPALDPVLVPVLVDMVAFLQVQNLANDLVLLGQHAAVVA